ncbi:MAG: sigma-70 family RNA polymerase sigma factor [Acutalibacteraceae bacterium]|nr:sigma-70 family RNA polymerase sigma factor [Clostridia bacterium]MEE3403917.1 sigma-70 family RNA polymerase sigma factor [Acutalibacteraceae bacterium]HCA54724.1 flagellar biosynthesis protein FliA [Oscillospiraceae bacterium]
MSESAVSVEENIGLVHTCARRFKGRGIEYDDLFQAGCMGLVKAAGHFDADKGFRFSTYAVPVILGEIRKLFRDGGTVKIARSLKELSLKVTKAVQDFQAAYGREPTVSELAERFSLSCEQIAEALNAGQQPLSLTMTDEDGETQTDIPVPPPEEHIIEHLALQMELSRLSEDDRKLIILRYYRGLTQAKTAVLLGTTQVQISRREKKLLLHLRKQLAS